MKQFIRIFLVIILILTLTGCWNNRDLTDLAIVTGVAIDKSDDEKFEITVQIVKPDALKPGGEGGGKESKAYVNVSSKGETMFDAVRNLLSRLNKKAYFPHVQLMVISEEVAREGVSNYFDFYERDPETRRRADIIISKGMKAKTVLEIESQLTKIPSMHNVEALEASDASSKSLKVTLLEVLEDFNKEGYSIVFPILYNSKQTDKVFQEDLILEGSAVIKKDKLVGFLDPIQTRGFLYAKNKVKSTVIIIPSPLSDEKKVSIEVIRSNGKIDAKIENGKPNLNIEVEAEGNIGEQHEKSDLTKPDMIQALENEVEKEIENEIKAAIKVTQEEYQSDIFGFINKINKNYYTEWKKIAPEWSNIYSDTPVNIKVKFKIRLPGLIKEPVEAK